MVTKVRKRECEAMTDRMFDDIGAILISQLAKAMYESHTARA